MRSGCVRNNTSLQIESIMHTSKKAIDMMQKYSNLHVNIEHLFMINGIESQIKSINDTFIKNMKMWDQVTSSISDWKSIYNSSLIQAIQKIAIMDSTVKKALISPVKDLENSIMRITTINISEKVFKFTSLQEQVMRVFKPYIMGLQSINIERIVIKKELKERAETLAKFGWWYISDISEESIDKIMEESENLSESEVNEIICSYFREESFNVINGLLDEWETFPFLAKKHSICEEALEAHKNGRYATAIQSLVLNGEGIIRDFVRETCGFTSTRWGPIYSRFKGMIEELEDFLYAYILSFIDYLYLNFDPQYPDNTNDFNRHKIAHGESVNHGTEVNSVKTILYINEIYHILNAITINQNQKNIIGE